MADFIKAEDDVMGQALMDYQKGNEEGKLLVYTNVAEVEEYDVAYFFRGFQGMPALEQKALELASGDILDVGAGTGIHSLVLQKMNKKCKAIDISELSVEIMEQNGVIDFACEDFFQLKNQKFDTLLFLMNGIGLVETMDGFEHFFDHCKNILNPKGQILFDSSDLIFLLEEEDGSFLINLADKYYGEVEFQVEYKGVQGKPFPWLFVDFDNMEEIAARFGFRAELIEKGMHYDYLARLTMMED